MAKNTQNTKFRSLNVSPYSDEEADDNDNLADDVQGPNEGEVQSLLNSYPCDKTPCFPTI